MDIIYFDIADPNDPSTQLSISYEEGDIVSITKAWKKLRDLWVNGVIYLGEFVNAGISLGHFDILNKLNNKENCEDFAELYFGKFGE